MPSLPLGVPSNIDLYFYNRKKELINLNSFIGTLNQNVANQILVTGYRGVGKSFLLKKFIKDLPENILTAYIDISHIYGTQKGDLTEEQIMHVLLEEMNNAIKDKGDCLKKAYYAVKSLLWKIKNNDYDFKEAGSVLGIALPDISDNYQKLSKFVMEYAQKIVDSSKGQINGFVIVIDEFQFIGALKSPDAFFRLFRSSTQEQDNVSYIFTGSTSTTSEMVNKINGINGAFGNRMIQFNVDSFKKEETEGYLKEKVSEIQFTDSGLERFYNCTRGYPAYINSFCNIMSADIIYNEKEVIKEFYQKLEQVAVKWITIWSSLSEHEKYIISTIIDYGPLKWNELLKKVNFSDGTLTKNLTKLKNKGILSHSDKYYKIDDHMLSAWLKYKKDEDGFYPH